MARYSAVRRRNNWTPLLTLLILVLIAGAVGLIALLVWSQVELRESRKPMLGPGTFPDASETYRFQILDGWQVVHQNSQTLIQHRAGSLPTYELEFPGRERMHLVLNWDCGLLLEAVPTVMEAILPWQGTITYTSVPCAQDNTQPAFGRVYLALDSGQIAVVVFGPVDGVTWVVARTVPFAGESSAALIEAMTRTVTSARHE